MADEIFEALQAACGLIKALDTRGVESHGTGFLVANERVATCYHVIEGAVTNGRLSVVFEGGEVAAMVLQTDERNDCAILEVNKAPSDAAPLNLGGVCSWKADWDGYGFPVVARDAGLFLDGIVSNPKGKDDKNRPSLHLWSRQVGSGMGAPLGGFSGSPVMVKGYVIGQLRRIIPDPQGSPGQPPRPAFGMVYATPAGQIAALLGTTPSCAEIAAPKSGSEGASRSADRVLELLDKWTQSGMPRDSAALLTAESLIQFGVPEKALSVLEKLPKSVRHDQLQALALAKTKVDVNIGEAINILERLRRAGHLDAETSGILAGRYKQRWEHSGDRKDLEEAYRVYVEAFNLTNDSYPGINAAALALQLEKASEARELARKVGEELKGFGEDMLDHWQLATVAEAALLLRDLDTARAWYAKAIRRYPEARENMSRMQSQAKFNLKALDLPENALDDVFGVG
jgi:tetratricopeptide (TPR) repeat protein